MALHLIKNKIYRQTFQNWNSDTRADLLDIPLASQPVHLEFVVTPDDISFLVTTNFPRLYNHNIAIAHPNKPSYFAGYSAHALRPVLALHGESAATNISNNHTEYFIFLRNSYSSKFRGWLRICQYNTFLDFHRAASAACFANQGFYSVFFNYLSIRPFAFLANNSGINKSL